MEEKIQKLIIAAIQAPSGENCQPWKFAIQGNIIQIYNDPLSDQSLYNYKQRGSLISHGAAIENMLIEATSLNLDLNINFFPEIKNQNFIAKIIVSEKEIEINIDPLLPYITKRVTNRKKYIKVQLSEAQINEIYQSATEIGTGKIKLLTDETKIQSIAYSLSMNERIIFENKYLHSFFYNHIRWTKEEEKKDTTGFFIKTLELDNKQYKGFRIFKNWFILNTLNNLFKVSTVVAKDNEVNYRSASAIGIITFEKSTNFDYVNAGRLFERIWLKISKMGLSLQPATGVIFLTQKILDGSRDYISVNEIKYLSDAYNNISSIFNISQQETIMVLFRIGKGSEPTAKSLRKNIGEFLTNINNV